MAGSVLFAGTYIESEDQNDDQLGGTTHSGWGDPDDFNLDRCVHLSWLPSVLGIVGGAVKRSLILILIFLKGACPPEVQGSRHMSMHWARRAPPSCCDGA